MTFPEMREPVVVSQRADDGSLIEAFDVVDGDHADLVDPIVEMHAAAFPEHEFVGSIIRERAASAKDDVAGVRPHQWLVQVDGSTAGFVLFDSNVARTVAVSHYVYLRVESGALTVDRRRLLGWLYRQIVEQLSRDCGGLPVLGLVGEAPNYRVPIFRWIGLQDFGIEYYEPVVGPRWQGPGSELRPLHLLWLPPDGVDPTAIEERARQAGSAAFLLDHYRFGLSEPWVARAVGSTGGQPRG